MDSPVNSYLKEFQTVFQGIDAEPIEAAVEMILKTIRQGHAIYVAGNGGSAATANHFAADFGKNVVKEDDHRPSILSVCANMAAVTAYANDEGFQYAFSRQMTNLLKKDDLVVVISASGNSPSVLECIKLARRREAHVIAMTGFSGGECKAQADICLHAPGRDYEIIEDMHMMFCHILVYATKLSLNAAKES